MPPMRTLIPLILLAACTQPLPPGEADVDAGPLRPQPRGEVPSEFTFTGTAGLGYTNARIRSELVDPECARRGLTFGSLSIGRIDDGGRPFTASCV